MVNQSPVNQFCVLPCSATLTGFTKTWWRSSRLVTCGNQRPSWLRRKVSGSVGMGSWKGHKHIQNTLDIVWLVSSSMHLPSWVLLTRSGHQWLPSSGNNVNRTRLVCIINSQSSSSKSEKYLTWTAIFQPSCLSSPSFPSLHGYLFYQVPLTKIMSI